MSWKNTRSLLDLCELTAAWLLGKIPDHISQMGSPDAETNKIRKYLICFNHAGFMTDFSQPGEPLRDGNAQRACLSGYCDENLAKTVTSLTLFTDLIVHAFPPGAGGGYQIPITIGDYHPFTWHGSYDPGTELPAYIGLLHREAITALQNAWYLIIIDPTWGRQRYLWMQVEKVMRHGTGPFDTRPSPDLSLGVDFIY